MGILAFGWGPLLFGPVVAVGVDVVLAEDLAGGLLGEGDLKVVDDHEDAFSGVGYANAEMVETAGPSEGEFAELVDSVEPDPVVTLEVSRRRW